MNLIVSIECPSCATAFPVDPDKVPVGGARTECTVCETAFRVGPESWGQEEAGAESWTASEEAGEGVAGLLEVMESDSESVVESDAESWMAEGDGGEGETSWEESARAFEDREVGDEAADDYQAAIAEGVQDEATPESTSPGEAFLEVVDGGDQDEVSHGEVSHEEEIPTSEAHPLGQDFIVEASPGEGLEVDEDDGAFGASDFETLSMEEGGSEPIFDASGFDTSGFDDAIIESPGLEDSGLGEALMEGVELDESPLAQAGEDLRHGEAGDEDPPLDSLAQTGELITDQWADLVDGDVDEGVEVTSDWGGDDGEAWVLETEDDSGLITGEIEVERLGTVEDHVRDAQGDPDLTAPAEGVDTNEVSAADGFGDFMSGEEMVLPEDALEVESPGLHMQDDEPFGGVEPVHVEEAEDHPAPAAEISDEPLALEGETGGATFQFGRRDPHDKAQRLARVLVSDMITYNPERHTEARQKGSVKEDFEEEIQKSWAEYVEQVGPELAETTDYWREALNDILADGEPLF